MSFLNNDLVVNEPGVKHITVTKLVDRHYVTAYFDGVFLESEHDTKGAARKEMSRLRKLYQQDGHKLKKTADGYEGWGLGWYGSIKIETQPHIITETVTVTQENRTSGRKVAKSEIAANSAGVSNLLAIFDHATVKELDHGLSWYMDAHKDALRLAHEYNTDLRTTCAVVAALSPSMRWSQNVEGARVVFEVAYGRLSWDNVKIATYNSNRDKATDIARTGDTSILSGTKVNAFASNIYDPTSHDHVTIDRHAIQAWFGRYEGIAMQVDDDSYAAIEDDYRTAAQLVGMRPCEFQAVIWVVWRRLNGLND